MRGTRAGVQARSTDRRAIPWQASGSCVRADLVVESVVLIEVKSVSALGPEHVAQTLSYLRLGNFELGLLMNFSAPLMKQGIKRLINKPF